MTSPAATPQTEAVKLPIKAIADYWKCSPMLAKRKLLRAGASIRRDPDGQAYIITTAKHPLYVYYKAQQAKKAYPVV